MQNLCKCCVHICHCCTLTMVTIMAMLQAKTIYKVPWLELITKSQGYFTTEEYWSLCMISFKFKLISFGFYHSAAHCQQRRLMALQLCIQSKLETHNRVSWGQHFPIWLTATKSNSRDVHCPCPEDQNLQIYFPICLESWPFIKISRKIHINEYGKICLC